MKTENYHAPPASASDFQSTRNIRLSRHSFVIRFARARFLWFATGAILLAFPALATAPELDNLLKSIEARYNRAQSLKLDFSETYAGFKRPVQTESGVLYLRKPGRMRWEYTLPAGKLFLSDGKEVFEYTPNDRQALRSKLKQSEDMRAPLAFLLGKLDFKKEFKSFQTKVEAVNTWIVAEPRSENLAYTEVEFLANPDGEIRRVRFTLQDQSKLDLTFSNQRLNVPVAPSLFAFHPPPGVQVVDEGQ